MLFCCRGRLAVRATIFVRCAAPPCSDNFMLVSKSPSLSSGHDSMTVLDRRQQLQHHSGAVFCVSLHSSRCVNCRLSCEHSQLSTQSCSASWSLRLRGLSWLFSSKLMPARMLLPPLLLLQLVACPQFSSSQGPTQPGHSCSRCHHSCRQQTHSHGRHLHSCTLGCSSSSRWLTGNLLRKVNGLLVVQIICRAKRSRNPCLPLLHSSMCNQPLPHLSRWLVGPSGPHLVSLCPFGEIAPFYNEGAGH